MHGRNLTLFLLLSSPIWGDVIPMIETPLLAQEASEKKEKADDTSPQKDPETRGRELMALVVAALGGDEKLQGLQSLGWTAVQSRMRDGGGVTEQSVVGKASFPDRIRMDIENPGPTRTQVTFCVDRNVGWIRQGSSVTDMRPTDVKVQREGLLVSTTPLIKAHAETKVRELEASQLEDKSYRVLEVKRKGLEPVTFWIDPDTHRIARRKMNAMSRGKRVVREERLWGYKEVQGLWLPFSRKILENGKVVSLTTVDSYRLNETYDDAVFARPGAGKP